MSDSSRTRFRLGGHEFGFSVIDNRDRYDGQSVDARYTGQLELDPPIAVALATFGKLARTFPGDLTMFDGDRLVISAPPGLTEDLARPASRVLRLRFKRTSYFAGALCRTLPTQEFADYLTGNWPDGTPTISQVRGLISQAPGFHPLRDPGNGVSICPVATDESGGSWTVLHLRGSSVAVNPGMWSTAIDEAFSLADISADGRLDPWATARRGTREELGIELADVSLFSFGFDPAFISGALPSYGCGYVFNGWGKVDVTPDKLGTLGPASSDAFETEDSIIVKLSADGVAAALSTIKPGNITAAALYGLLGTLDRIQPGAAAMTERLLSDFWR